MILKDLRRHEKIHQPAEHKFLCDRPGCIFAKRGFARRDHLIRHQKAHGAADNVPAIEYHETHVGDDRTHCWMGALELSKQVVSNDQCLVNAFKLF
jgi:hypothetical protein